MSAQPQTMPIPIENGVNEKPDLTVVQQPVIIENARYARSGALSKRNGYAFDDRAPLPTLPYSSEENEYVAFDGDKFVARKTPTGLTFYQRRGVTGAGFGRTEQREIGVDTLTSAGTASRLRPELFAFPATRADTSKDGLLCDFALPAEFMGTQAGIYVYVRLEQVDFDPVRMADVFDVVVEYLDAYDTRLTVREPSRLERAISYTEADQTYRQIRVIHRSHDGTGIMLVYTDDHPTGGTGIWARQLDPGSDAAGDVWGPSCFIVGASAADTSPVFKRPVGAFDCDHFLYYSTPIAFSILYATKYGLAWARVTNLAPVTVSIYEIAQLEPPFRPVDVFSVAMSGLPNGLTQEVVFSYVALWGGTMRCGAGRFNALISGAPTGISTRSLADDTVQGLVPPHTAVAGRFRYLSGGALVDTYLAGVNTGHKGFVYALGDKGQPALYDNTHTIACAWATGRPHTTFNFRGDFVRVAMPMVSFGGVLGGGAGLLADLTPRGIYGTAGNPINGAPLLATYAIDQISLRTASVPSYLQAAGTDPIRTADWNIGLNMRPIHGSEIPFGGDFAAPRWLCALGVPPTATMLQLTENHTDFEFVEPGVMLTGAGVPVMLDTIHGLSELGFHTSPVLLRVSGFSVLAGTGYPLGTIFQYRFQYRFVDGTGRAQVSPPTDPILVTATIADSNFYFEIAPLDVTLRHHGAVVIDVYRTEDKQATFYWIGSVYGKGGAQIAVFYDRAPARTVLDKTRTINIENFFMTPPCATHAFRGAFRDVIITHENELWPSKRRLSTTAPQFDIIDTAAWDAPEPVVTGGEIDGKLVLLSTKRVAYTYEQGGGLAPFVDIPCDAGAVDGSRAFSTHLGVFYQAPPGIRIVGRDLALHETGMPIGRTLGASIIRGGIKVPAQGEIRLRLDDGRTYLVFDYMHGSPDKPVWYVTRFNEQGPYDDDRGFTHATGLRAIADQAFAPDGRLLYLCRLGFLLEETVGRYRDEDQWVPMRVRSGPMRGGTALSYLATIEGAVNLELAAGGEPAPVTLRLFADYEESVPSQAVVTRAWTVLETEAFDRRQLQITAGERVMNAPAASLEYSDENPGNVDTTTDGRGYRLSSMVMVYGPRDQKTLFPVSNGARK